MKRIYSVITIVLLSTLLVGCGEESLENEDVFEDGAINLMITEYIEGANTAKAVEIYNPTDDVVNLENYIIGIYKNGQTDLTYKINLENTLESKECYVVVYDESPQELLDKADLVSNDLYYTGDDPITLMYKDNVVSQLGNISGLSINYGQDTSLVKLDVNSNLGNYTYIESDWVEYNTDDYSNLGTIEHSITEEDLIKGPELLDKYLDIPFFPEGTNASNFLTQIGTGGAVEVTLKSCGDGDTTYFYYPEEWAEYNIDSDINRFRYFGIDTPESSSNVVPEAWGKTASNYVCSRLTSAKTIHIQSIEGYSVNGTYNRLMGLVWVDGVLLQNEIVKMGYSQFTHAALPFSYNNFPLTSYLIYNAKVAKSNGKGIWGELDPLWDYENNAPLGW